MPSTRMKMKPMFLPGIEQNPQPGLYAEMIRCAQESGGEYWKIWNLFAFRPPVDTGPGGAAVEGN
jgi:hypothetical protein